MKHEGGEGGRGGDLVDGAWVPDDHVSRARPELEHV